MAYHQAMRTSLAATLVLVSLPLTATGHAQARERAAPAPAGVLLIAGPASYGWYVRTGNDTDMDDTYEIPARYAVPIACKGGRGGIRGGSACLARTPARTSIRVDEETLPVRRVARVAACHLPTPDFPEPMSTGLELGDRHLAFRPLTLAVWPANADVSLELVPSPTNERERALSLDLDGDGAPENVAAQSDLDGGGKHRGRIPPRATWIDITNGKDATRSVRVEPFSAANRLVLLATSDVDRDGLRELILYAEYVNDYGIAVIEYGSTTPVYSFNCGNI
jgi:hypothetical protein